MKRRFVRRLLVLGALLGAVVGLALIGGVLVLESRWGQRQVEQRVRAQLARRSALVLAPLAVEFSVWRDFPYPTVSLRHVLLTDTAHGRRVPVLRVDRVEGRLSVQQLWRGRWHASRLTLYDGEFQQFTDAQGRDWSLRGRGPRQATPAAPPDFDLDSLILQNVQVKDRNDLQGSGFAAHVAEARLAARVRAGVAQVRGTLGGQLNYLRSGRGNLFEQEPIRARVTYRYDFRRRQGTFLDTRATLNGDTVHISGTHRGAAPGQPRGTQLDLRFEGRQPLVDVLRVALPAGLQRHLAGARSGSHARIRYTVQGLSGPTARPRTVLHFALQNAQLQWADSARRIQRWDARGVFDNGPAHAPHTTSLRFEHCRVYSAAGELDAALDVRDFTRPQLHGRVRGRTELQTLAALVAPGLWRARGGQAALDLQLRGLLPTLPSRAQRRAGRAPTSTAPLAVRGTVRLERAALLVPGRGAEVSALNVHIRLLDSLWTLENLAGRFNGMQVQANARTTYLLAYVSGQHAATTVAGAFAVDELRLDKLQRLLAPPGRRTRPRPMAPGRTSNQALAARAVRLLPPGLHLNIQLRCGRLALPSDTLERLAATVRHDGRRLQLSGLSGRVWGGHVRGAVSWPTDTVRLQPVAVQLALRFDTLDYARLLSRLTRPSRRTASAPTDPTLREVLLAANGRVTATVGTLRLPGSEHLHNLRVQLNKIGTDFQVPRLDFRTGTGGVGRLRASARLVGASLARAHAELSLRYAALDVQTLLGLLAALGTVPETVAAPSANPVASKPRRTQSSPFVDGTVTGQVRVTAAQVRYGALRGQQFKVTSGLAAGQAQLTECSLRAFGGTLALRGTLRTVPEQGRYPLRAQLRLRGIQLPDLFETAGALGFDVFGPANIRGALDCEADVRTGLGAAFLPSVAHTHAFLRTDLTHLELLDVDALGQALRFLNEKRTRHLYFEPVSPRFGLDGGRLLIPDLALSSNLTDLRLSGQYGLNGQADLYVGMSPAQALFGNNDKRVARIENGEARGRPGRGLVYVRLRRQPGSRYRMSPFQKPAQRRQQAQLWQQYHQLLRTQQLDTTLRLLP